MTTYYVGIKYEDDELYVNEFYSLKNLRDENYFNYIKVNIDEVKSKAVPKCLGEVNIK